MLCGFEFVVCFFFFFGRGQWVLEGDLKGTKGDIVQIEGDGRGR